MLTDGGVAGNVASLNLTDHPLDSTGYVGYGISFSDPTQNIGNTLYFIVAFFFGFCIIGGILGKAVVVDKEFQIRLQMNLMGVDKPTYWFSNYLVDFIMIFIAGSVMAGISAAFQGKIFFILKISRHFILTFMNAKFLCSSRPSVCKFISVCWFYWACRLLYRATLSARGSTNPKIVSVRTWHVSNIRHIPNMLIWHGWVKN